MRDEDHIETLNFFNVYLEKNIYKINFEKLNSIDGYKKW